MPSKSKTKGNKFENDIVKCFNELHQTEEFRRTPNSGAMMGRSNAAKFAGLSENVQRTLSSDIITPEWYPFAIECKHYGDKPNYATIIKDRDTTLDHWIGEAIFDAINQDLHPMLCFKTDRKGTHVAVPTYWCHANRRHPDIYLTYHDFIIIGLDVWKDWGAERLTEYRDSEEFRAQMEFGRRSMPVWHTTQYFLEQLET